MFQKIYFFLLFILTASMAHSQCTESLGTPIINETFGSGTSQFGPALPSGATNLLYAEDACPIGFHYTIANYAAGCYGASNTLTDHTGNKNGYFMLVNPSQSGGFFVQAVNGLCSGTTYQFSVYIVDTFQALEGVYPSITLTIEKTDGTILSSYNSGHIYGTSPANWKQYSLSFQPPAGVSNVVLKISNDGPIDYGLAVDDITFTSTGPKSAVTINGIKGDTVLKNVCYADINLAATVANCYVNNAYQWQISTDSITWNDIPGATQLNYDPNLQNPGTYWYRLTVAENGNIDNLNCRVNSNVITIIYTPYPKPVLKNISAQICPGTLYTLPSGKTVSSTGVYADTVHYKQGGCDSLVTNLNLTVYDKPDLGPDKLLCIGDSIILNPGLFVNYLWQDGSNTPTYKVKTAGTYWVKVTDGNGCETLDTINIKATNCSLLKIPNAFTPNGDGINDTWDINALQNYPACTVFIYDRWGLLLFKSTGYGKPWNGQFNGKNLPTGTYYYVINLKNNTPPISGYVAIIK